MHAYADIQILCSCFIGLRVYPCSSVCLSVCLKCICLSMSVQLSACVCARPQAHGFAISRLCLGVCLSARISFSLSVCISVKFYLSVCVRPVVVGVTVKSCRRTRCVAGQYDWRWRSARQETPACVVNALVGYNQRRISRYTLSLHAPGRQLSRWVLYRFIDWCVTCMYICIAIVIVIVRYKPLESQAAQGTSLFTSAASRKRSCKWDSQ